MSDTGFEGNFEAEAVVSKPVEPPAESVDVGESVGDVVDPPASDALVSESETVEDQPSKDTAPAPKSLQDQLKEIEENDDPDKFGQRVKLYQEATAELVGGKDVTVQQFLANEELKNTKSVEFLALETQVQQIFNEYQNVFQEELKGLSADQAKLKAVEIVGKLTGKPITAKQLSFVDENGQVDSAVFQTFLAENTNVTHLVEEFVKLHDMLKQPMKEHKAVQAEVEKQMISLQEDSSKTEEEKRTLLQEYLLLQGDFEKAFDKLDVAGAINTLFAIEHGYGSYGRFDSFHNGLEKKKDLSEQRTLAALQQVFSDEETTGKFFRGVFSLEEDYSLSASSLQQKMKELLEVESTASEEEKKQKIVQTKEKIFKGFEKAGRTGLIASIDSPESINLSASVIQSLVQEVEKMK